MCPRAPKSTPMDPTTSIDPPTHGGGGDSPADSPTLSTDRSNAVDKLALVKYGLHENASNQRLGKERRHSVDFEPEDLTR